MSQLQESKMEVGASSSSTSMTTSSSSDRELSKMITLDTLESALEMGHYLKDFLSKVCANYDSVMSSLTRVERQHPTGEHSWRHIMHKSGINELPTSELLSFTAFLAELLGANELLELESQHSLFSCLIKQYFMASKDAKTKNIRVRAVHSEPLRYIKTYYPTEIQTVPDVISRLSGEKRREELENILAVYLWPSPAQEPILQTLLQKELIIGLIIVGEPEGLGCLSKTMGGKIKEKYNVLKLNLRQVCFMDSSEHANQYSRSSVTLYLSKSLPHYSSTGLRMAFGEKNFLPKDPPELTPRQLLKDYVSMERIPLWCSKVADADVAEIFNTVTNVMSRPMIFDGCIPDTVKNMTHLRFWYEHSLTPMKPIFMNEHFETYYDMLQDIRIEGMRYFWEKKGMPRFIETFLVAEQWLWVKFSQKVSIPGWDRSSLELKNRFEQLIDLVRRDEKAKHHILQQQQNLILRGDSGANYHGIIGAN
jgi:hypothetical protein